MQPGECPLYKLWQLGQISQHQRHDLTRQSSQQLLGSYSFQADFRLVRAGSGSGRGGPGSTNPIGALHDIYSPAHDEAVSIAILLANNANESSWTKAA